MEIINYPNYLIYNDGRVYSKYKNIFMKPKITKEGYLSICLYSNGKKNHIRIHRLVGIHYIPNPNNKPTIDHINRKRDDNRVENLRWATLVEQSKNRHFPKTININSPYGFKYINYRKKEKKWVYRNKHIGIYKRFKTKIQALCYKYIVELRIKAKHFD